MAYSSDKIPRNTRSFTSNSPVYSKTKSVKSPVKGNVVFDLQGNPMLKEPDTSGELLKLQKRHYASDALSAILEGGFSELANTKEEITPESFFEMYRNLFYSIPKVGKESHTTLIEESTAYVGNYEDPKDEKMDSLLERVIELEQQSVETPSEHPLFRNGTAIRKGSSLGIMQEGHLRRVSNRGNPSPYQMLKKALGKTDADGQPLTDEESWTRVNAQTWNSLPKWPAGSDINESADWSLSLKSFNPAVSNITQLTDLVEQSELDQQEIDFLINKLTNKQPFFGNTIEDNFNGTITWTPEELQPFGYQGTRNGETAVYNYKNNQVQGIKAYVNSIIAKHANRPDKGIYNLDHDSELMLETDFRYDFGERPYPISLIIKGMSSAYRNKKYHDYYSNDNLFTYDHEAVDEILALKEEFASTDDTSKHPLVRFEWGVDFERGELYGIDDGKFFWNRDKGLGYKNYAIQICNIAVGKLRKILNTNNKFISHEFNYTYRVPNGQQQPAYYRHKNRFKDNVDFFRPGSGNYNNSWNNASFYPDLVDVDYSPFV